MQGSAGSLAGCRTSIGPSDTWGQQGKIVTPEGQFNRAALPDGVDAGAGWREPSPMAPPTAPCTPQENSVRLMQEGHTNHQVKGHLAVPQATTTPRAKV